MKWRRIHTQLLLLITGAVTVVLGLVSSSDEGNVSRNTVRDEAVRPDFKPPGSGRIGEVANGDTMPLGVVRGGREGEESFRLFDRFLEDRLLLVSKTRNEGPASGSPVGADLWLRDFEQTERFVADSVIEARFSPDGKKIAYCTSDDELFVESIDGQRLAQIPRACNIQWSRDSTSIVFLAVPASDYSEMQQIIHYDLNSGQVSKRPASE